MSIPRAAALRQQQSVAAQSKAKERFQADQQQQQQRTMPGMRPNPQAQFQQQARFAATNRMQPQRRNKNEDFITDKELEEAMEEHHDSGKQFRRFFFIFILLSLGVMVLQKYDTEVNLDVPLLDDGSGDGLRFPEAEGGAKESATPKEDGGAGDTNEISESELYDILGVKNHLKKAPAAAATPDVEVNEDDDDKTKESKMSEAAKAAADKAAADKERRRGNYQVRKELKKAYESHLEGYGQVVSCGRNCEAKHQQVELAYNSLNSKVERELYGVLLDAKNSKTKRGASKGDLKEAYEAKKQEIEQTEEEGSDDRAMALEELKDAYDILENPEARTYYHLYGAKPPPQMKKTSARHGGWGQEMMLGTYKYRIINAWLDQLGSSWAEIFILCVLLGLVISRVAPAVEQATAILEAMEDEAAMDDKDKAGAAAAADPAAE